MRNSLKVVEFAVLMLLLAVSLNACGSGSDSKDKPSIAGHYKGTLRYNIEGYEEFILTTKFDATETEMTNMTIDGEPVDTSGSDLISESTAIKSDGTIVGQGSFNTYYGLVTFSFEGFITTDGQVSIKYIYSGALYGTVNLIATRQ